MSARRRNSVIVAIAIAAATMGCGRDSASQAAEVSASSPPPAAIVVSNALQTAAAGNKTVLIEFGASWCSWCRRFDAFVHSPDASSIVAANYVVVNLVVQERDDKKRLEHPGGQDIMDKWGGANAGLPFYVFLDAKGEKIADSNVMPDGGNLGFPGNPKEAELFLGLIDKTAPRLAAGDRAKIVSYLAANIKS
jgi:thiol:disulfide interchange protein